MNITLAASAFATLDDARRFIWWAQEPGQILSDWDRTRLEQAKRLLPEGPGEEGGSE